MDLSRRLRTLILEGELVPNQRLVETDLAEHFGVSRAAVRTALGELVNDGLVERVQNRGARVRVIALDEAIEIAEVRRALESLCAGKAAERVTDAEAEELRLLGSSMQEAVAAGDMLRYSELNRRLHARVHEIGGQRTANTIVERLRGQVVRHQYRLALRPGRPAVSVHEHQAIIDAIRSRDRRAAEEAMTAHLDSVMAAMRDADDDRRRARGR